MDLAAVVGRVRGMLFEPDATLAAHGVPAPGWRIVVREHVLPVLILTSIIALPLLLLLVSAVEGGPGAGLLVLALAARVVVNLVGLFIMAAVVRFYAGMFGANSSFDAAFVLVALAMTPFYVAGMLAPGVQLILSVPAAMVFILLSIGYSFAILYRGIGLVLRVPQEQRGAHFGLTLVTLVVLSTLLFLLLGPYILPMPA
ncbi:YIP1 family protein [Inquilinus sp. CA228]|uniref:YIP1 family protein n=1 Tax=Inquilinus sp. CA228 TaxID=3455609 RepID=UPI003F8D439B